MRYRIAQQREAVVCNFSTDRYSLAYVFEHPRRQSHHDHSDSFVNVSHSGTMNPILCKLVVYPSHAAHAAKIIALVNVQSAIFVDIYPYVFATRAQRTRS
jgi:hypothetical protein